MPTIPGPIGIMVNAVLDSLADIDPQGLADGVTLDDVIDEFVTAEVPVMTTSLFQLVIDDNTIAFLGCDDNAEPPEHPFAALSGAVHQRVGQLVREHLEQEQSRG